MLRFFSFNHPFSYVLLLGLVFVLRAPSFHSNYFSDDESHYIVAGEKIAEGGTQYIDTWDNKPPIIGWFYAGFVWLFGGFALTAIRIFTCLYLFVAAVLLNQLIIGSKLLSGFTILPAFIFILLSSVPWYAQELNAELLMALPVIFSFYQLVLMSERETGNDKRMAVAGLLLGLCIMIKYQAFFLLLGFFVAYLITYPPRLREMLSLFMGWSFAIGFFLLLIYFSGAFDAFWDMGVLYNLDYILIGKNPDESVSALFNLGQYVQLWGVFFLLGLFGMGFYRLNYFSHTIQIRKVELLFICWFIAAFLSIFIGFSRLYLHYFILLTPPLAMYSAKFFELKISRKLKSLAFIAAMTIPMFTYGVFMVSAFPKTFSVVDNWIEDEGWIEGFRKTLNEPHIVSHHIDTAKVRNGILVLDYQPDLYLRLGLPCATPYTNFSMAYYKFTVFEHSREQKLSSKMETIENIYESFSRDMPEYIIDAGNLGLFPELKEKLPVLFAKYRSKSAGKYKIYYLN